MTAERRFVPVPAASIEAQLVFLRAAQDYTGLVHQARDIAKELGELLSIAGDHQSRLEMYCMELLEAIGRSTGRPTSTVVTQAAVAHAVAALSEVVPALGSNVVALRVPTRDTKEEIEAAAARAFAEHPAPLSVQLMCDGQHLGAPIDSWRVPQLHETVMVSKHIEGEVFPRARRVPVLDVVWVGTRNWEVHVGRTGNGAAAQPVARDAV